MLDAVVARFEEQSPLTLMARLIVQRVLDPSWLDALFETERHGLRARAIGGAPGGSRGTSSTGSEAAPAREDPGAFASSTSSVTIHQRRGRDENQSSVPPRQSRGIVR